MLTIKILIIFFKKFVTKYNLLRQTYKIRKKGGDDVEINFEQLYRTYYMQVYSFVMALSKCRDVSEEITQKVFFKVMTTDKKYRGDSSELTWLCAIAKNLFIDELRVQKKSFELTETENVVCDVCIETNVADEDSAFQIHQVLHSMSEPYKEVFQLRVFGELPFQKIGNLFGKTENWARVTYHRARLMIKERMERL